ncbi:MAG TPA: MFS transporter [Alphaproteobacteria bacterium]|nr:MFS transporter [Alphaproteobacteria bacterium]
MSDETSEILEAEYLAASKERGSTSDSWPLPGVAWYSVFILIVSVTFAMLDNNIVTYLTPYIKHDLNLTDVDLGLLLGGSFGLFYTLVGVPLAYFIDRYSRKIILMAGITTWSLGTVLCGGAQNFIQLFISRFLVGAGEAVNGPTSYSILSDLFPRARLPRAIATMQLGSILGPALALFISAFLIKAFAEIPNISVPWGTIHGWQLIFVMVGAPGILVAILMAVSLPEPKRRMLPQQLTEGVPEKANLFGDYAIAFKYLFKHWAAYGPLFLGLAVSSLQAGNLQWMPIFYLRTFGWKPADVALLNSAVQLTGVPLFLLIGVVMMNHYEKVGSHTGPFRVLIISRILALPISLIAPLVSNPWLSWALFSFSTITVGMAGPSQNVAMQSITPSQLRGKLTALYLLIFSVVGVSIGPMVTALITDLVLHDESQIKWAIFLSTAVFAPISLIIFFFGVKPYAKEVERVKMLEAQAG